MSRTDWSKLALGKISAKTFKVFILYIFLLIIVYFFKQICFMNEFVGIDAVWTVYHKLRNFLCRKKTSQVRIKIWLVPDSRVSSCILHASCSQACTMKWYSCVYQSSLWHCTSTRAPCLLTSAQTHILSALRYQGKRGRVNLRPICVAIKRGIRAIICIRVFYIFWRYFK